jgi:hypothetical protein
MEVDFGIFLLVVRGRRSLLLRRGFGLVLDVNLLDGGDHRLEWVLDRGFR